MLERAAAKGLPTMLGDAQALPFPDSSFDAAMLVSMLHHVEQPPLALTEARRVVRPGGRIAAMLFTWEDVRELWLLDYFPSSRGWMEATHPRLSELLAHLPGAEPLPVVFTDIEDASLVALSAHPALLLEDAWRRQTSFFERLERDHPAELEAGLARLRADLATGAPVACRGRATVLSWAHP